MNKLNRGFKLPKKFIQSIMFAKGHNDMSNYEWPHGLQPISNKSVQLHKTEMGKQMKNSGYQLIKYAINHMGFEVSVQDPEDCDNVFYRGKSIAKAWDEAQCMDWIALEFYHIDPISGEETYAGWASLIHGNQPNETVSDYSGSDYANWIDTFWNDPEYW